MELAPGTVLLGKYRVEDVLGVGGMGRVVRASHLYLNQSFAIKLLLPAMVENPSTVARFLREAQTSSQLKGEHFARVLDVGTLPDGVPYMVMEYLEGSDLNQILRHHGPQLPGLVCDLILQACEGLAEAHSLGFVHRDIKPSNFFVTQRPDGSMLLKILDFGISKTPVGYDDLTGTQTVIGTPSYMAPEQMKSVRSADARADIWSLGVVMYQLLEGRPPFSGETYAELVIKVGMEPPDPMLAQLPPGLGDVLARCLIKDPAQRQQDVGELARMLSPFASDPIVGAQIAARATRIVQQRASLPGFGGPPSGMLAPVALGPLTPHSWPPVNTPTSVSQGKGQVTYRTSRSKSWLIIGAVSVAVLAGAGGFVASEMIRSGDEPKAAATPTAPSTPTPSTASTTPIPTPTPTTPTTPTAPTTATTPTATKPTATTSTAAATATTATATTATATTVKATTAKSTTAKATTAKTNTKTKSGTTKSKSGLFDSRH